MKVTYLGHDGFVVETQDQILIFDCIASMEQLDGNPPSKKTSRGPISHGSLAPLDPDKKITVFVSHSHGDHYSTKIWKLMEKYPDTEFYLGNDIEEEDLPEDFADHCPGLKPDMSKIHITQPDEVYSRPGVLLVETLLSTDAGVAFYVTLNDGTTIFHAGDLLLWLWDGNTPEENEFFITTFYRELARISGRKTDIAFLPFDPRLEGKAALSCDEYLEALDVKFALPMHFWKEYDKVKEFAASFKDKPKRRPIHVIEKENQVFEI